MRIKALLGTTAFAMAAMGAPVLADHIEPGMCWETAPGCGGTTTAAEAHAPWSCWLLAHDSVRCRDSRLRPVLDPEHLSYQGCARPGSWQNRYGGEGLLTAAEMEQRHQECVQLLQFIDPWIEEKFGSPELPAANQR